jgi:predicted GIY-YIG superfamily endonuclease
VWWLYILRCGDGSLYTGITNNVAARFATHESGKGAKYTRGRGPLALIVTRKCLSKGDALRLEYAVKSQSRTVKEDLCKGRALANFARNLGCFAR